MKIYQGKYGYQTTAHSKDLGGNENKCYIDVQFKRGTEPQTEIEGDLFFKGNDGTVRKCFLTSYRNRNGEVKPKLMVLEPGNQPRNPQRPQQQPQQPRQNWDTQPQYQQPQQQPQNSYKEVFGPNTFHSDDLPF